MATLRLASLFLVAGLLLSSSAQATPSLSIAAGHSNTSRAGAAATGALVFASYRNGLSTIDTISANGGGKHQLTASQRSFAGEPAFSPDGSKIAYVCGNFELCVMNADGTGQGRLTTSSWPQSWQYVDHPTWSPDGTKIAFASNAGGSFHIYVINADGTGLHRLAGTARNDDDPSWSPDGTKIAFDSYPSSGGTSAIYVMYADGTQPRQLSASGVFAEGPSWAPDGSRLAFTVWKGHDFHIFTMGAGGGGIQQLTHGSCDETAPTWIPDESGLAFARSCAGRLGITIGQFGSTMFPVTAPRSGFDLYPGWQPTPAGGAAATSIGPPSTPTGDARVASAWFYWQTQVLQIDFVPSDSPGLERRILADDRAALAGMKATHPNTRRGNQLRSTAMEAFLLDGAAAQQYVLSYRAYALRKHRLAALYGRAGTKLARRAEQRFNAAYSLARLPY